MGSFIVAEQANHKFIFLNESKPGEEEGIRSNQYLILHEGQGVLLDPGGFGVMPQVLVEMLRYCPPEAISAIILSHQDPDILGGLSGWLELVSCPIYISRLWLRFIPHYGIRTPERFVGVPDQGLELAIAPGFALKLVPAHFLHSQGQINVYDPQVQVLFTGDIGAAITPAETEPGFVDDFAAHLPYVESFHRRYMGSNRAARLWVETISGLNIQFLAPQHGPVYRGQAVAAFLSWFKELECGIDLLEAGGVFREPSHGS